VLIDRLDLAPGPGDGLLLGLLRMRLAVERGDPELADRILGAALTAFPDPTPLGQERLWCAVAGARVQRARRAARPRDRAIATATTARLAELTTLVERDCAVVTPMTEALGLTFRAEVGERRLDDWDRAAAAWRALGAGYELATVLTGATNAALAANNRSGARLRLAEARGIAAELRAAPLLARIDDLATRGRLDLESDGDREAGGDREGGGAGFGLTRRELDVLRVLARGRSNAQLADELYISRNTAATHVARILTKLAVTSRTEAAAVAHREGLLGDGQDR
jgi:DNA-binding CsgD family transcriptional regulator